MPTILLMIDTNSKFRRGNPNLLPEESDNTSWGIVWTPGNVEGLTITWDDWRIEKDNTIVLFGRTNSMVADLVARINYGAENCDGLIIHS